MKKNKRIESPLNKTPNVIKNEANYTDETYNDIRFKQNDTYSHIVKGLAPDKRNSNNYPYSQIDLNRIVENSQLKDVDNQDYNVHQVSQLQFNFKKQHVLTPVISALNDTTKKRVSFAIDEDNKKHQELNQKQTNEREKYDFLEDEICLPDYTNKGTATTKKCVKKNKVENNPLKNNLNNITGNLFNLNILKEINKNVSEVEKKEKNKLNKLMSKYL